MLTELVHQLPHLTRRFFGVVFALPLQPTEQAWIAEMLTPAEAELFWAQAPADQRHGFETARRIGSVVAKDEVLIRAGLLHDVGKRHVTLGPIGRSLATVLHHLGLPLPAEWDAYRSHAARGASDLEEAGADPLVAACARLHQRSDPPPGLDLQRWRIFRDADAL